MSRGARPDGMPETPAATLRERLRQAVSLQGAPSSDFDLNPAVSLPAGRRLRDAAVLIAVRDDAAGAQVILTKRSSRLEHHPGQIALPGGKIEPGEDAVAAALREAREEIGLPGEAVEILGRLPAHETVTGFSVTPVLGWLRSGFTAVPEAGEVEEVFSAPLAHVTDPRVATVQSRRWRGERRHYYTMPWGPYYIWGATARILRALGERLDRCS